MSCFKKYFCFLFVLLLVTHKNHLYSQTYPVQISTQLIPPYSGYLPDYADPGSEKLKVILMFNDFTVSHYNLRLKIEIKGNGFSMVTKSFYNPPPITLQPGQPLLLSGADLAPYLNSNNLDFVGINQGSYEQRMALPEGYYSICVKAYDYYTPGNIQVSNESCAQAWFTYSNPPLLNLPFCNAAVIPQTPQNIIFQWTPVNLGSPNSAFNTYYDFMLYEVRPDSNANVNQIVLSAQPVYSVTTQQTFINYSITEPNLNLYMKYVWRVRVRDISGRDWINNNGYSQICTFNYGTAKSVLGNAVELAISAESISHRLGRATWNLQSIFSSYRLQVRKINTANWFDSETTINSEKIPNLEPNTTYECRVRGEGRLIGDWSNTASFKTPEAPNYTCNNQTILPDALTPQPLPQNKAVKGLIIQSGQFEIKTQSITPTGSPGWYSGKGIVNIFGTKPSLVKWSNIYIDDNNRHQQGIIEALSTGTDKWTHQWDVTQAEENAHYTNGNIDSIYISNNEICYTLKGNTIPICIPTQSNTNTMVIRDGEGNEYIVQLIPAPPKIIQQTNYLNYSADSLAANDSLKVIFKQSTSESFGFDEKQYAAYIDNYEVIKLAANKNYFVPNKSIGTNSSDGVLASITITNFTTSLLNFKTQNGTVLQSSNQGNNTFKITGIPANATCVYAWYKNKKIGKLNIISLKALSKKLVIVPVNNNTANITANDLNAIYKQANVSWSIKTAPNFTFDLGGDGLEAADATLLSKYSTEMRALKDAYRQQDTTYDKNAHYVFVVPNFTDPTIKGYMVRGRAVGFISPLSSENAQTVRLLSHELAHGAFGLEHSFPKIEKGSSTNLLDYTTGVQLIKEQWNLIQSGNFIMNWLDDEEDAALALTQRQDLLKMLLEIKKGYKEKSVINIGKYTSVMSIGKTYLNGLDYNDITTIIMPYVQTLGALSPNVNNITTSSFNSSYPASGPDKPCIDIEGKIKIFVPEDRIENLKIFLKSSTQLKNMILFVNGYRDLSSFDGSSLSSTSLLETANTNNSVNQADLFNYWAGIDQKFSLRIGTRNLVYADGHHSVGTSNHGSVTNFLLGMMASDKIRKTCMDPNIAGMSLACRPEANDSPSDVDFLHTSPMNVGGFNLRKTNGALAGNDLVNKINNGTFDFNKATDSLDIVAHSMGYAYSLGMIEKLKQAGIKLGRLYIIAPENACSGGTDWSAFTEVWQYGSNLGEPANDPMYLQDGVAPQCKVTGIEQLPQNTKGGRVFIPNTITTRGFVGSHSISNYGWIFEKGINDAGYVKSRN